MSKTTQATETLFKTIGTNTPRPDAIDKVTGKAVFGADVFRSNMLHAKMLGSPHAHARILSIDTSRAEALRGVKAVVTGGDLAPISFAGVGNWARDNMAIEKALYHGHTVAAVAATSLAIAERALELIDIRYEQLPMVLDINASMQLGAPELHDGIEGAPSNIYEREEISNGDIESGFAQADVILEQNFSSPTVHQGYIEPPACVAEYSVSGSSQIWTSTQGHFITRANVAATLGIELSRLKVTPTEIGGGFGGKGAPYLEVIALLLSKKAGLPVKMVMSRQEVLRIAGPGAAFQGHYKIGAKQDGTITALQADIALDSGAFPGAPLHGAIDCLSRHYRIPNLCVKGCAVLTNKPMVRAYRGPGGPQAVFGTESLMNDLAHTLAMDPLALRLKNAVSDGDASSSGKFKSIGLIACIEAAQASEHYNSEIPAGAARAVSAGYWHNGGGPSSAEVHMNADGTVNIATGSVDLSGTRIVLAMQAAEELGIPVEQITAHVADTENVGFTFVSGGSRTAFVTGLAVIDAAKDAKEQMAQRAASEWNILAERVEWHDGKMVNPDQGQTLTMKQVLRKAPYTGGSITGKSSLSMAGNLAPSFMVHVCDVEVDKETGQTKLLRYTVIQDVGKAVHPAIVEGQLQGGAVQGIGWALNEEYIYDEQGQLDNPGFLDYRIPLASDLPMIETIIVEVPNPLHPYGVRGVGEGGVIPPLAAVASAISKAVGAPMNQLPCSPPRVLEAISKV